MNQRHSFVRLFMVCLVCLGLVWPLEAAATQKRKRSTKKAPPKKRSTKSRASARRNVPPRPTVFDVIPAEDRSAQQAVQQALQQAVQDAEQAGARIEDGVLRAHVKYLADDLLEGRGTGTRGGMLAAKYIAAQFEALGLEPATSDRTYFQQVEMIGVKADPSLKLVVKRESASVELAFGDEFIAGSDLEQPEIPLNTDVVFVGHGIQAPEYNWDDYKGLDVRGRIVMIMVNDPPATAAEPQLFGGRALTYYRRWTYKYEEAARRGAAGAILIHTNDSAGYGWNVVRNSWGGEQFGLAPDEGAPALKLKSWVTEEAARRLARLSGHDLDQLRRAAQTREFRPVPLNVRVETTWRASTRRVKAPNVAGLLRGSDPNLRSEFLVYSAHWDHLGMRTDQPGDHIYNGAVDNATGVAGLLAIAKAYIALKTKPKRSILFLATTAEEQGLLGAEYYTRNPLAPLAKTVANINLDSLNVHGLTTDITPLGAERSTLGQFIQAVAGEQQLTVAPDARPEQGSFYRSDHFPFAKAGIPAVSFNSGSRFVGHSERWGVEQFNDYRERRYHQPADEYSPSWNFNGMVQQTRLAFWVGLRVANAAETPQWHKGDEFERARLQSLSRSQ
jgi:Zn-dependent M28 family amino/carboxypeptidase